VCAIYHVSVFLNEGNKSGEEETDKVKMTIFKERETERKAEVVNSSI
jgi:hypothetical protein